MIIRGFSVTGEALNFGARRMETIIRVGWLPLVLLLVWNMLTFFIVMSIATGEGFAFSDQIPNFATLKKHAAQAYVKASAVNAPAMMVVNFLNFAVNMILVASFMAPLIRFAGLGERPRPGIVKVAFGADQIRYIVATLAGFLISLVAALAPMLALVNWATEYIDKAMSKTFASFPDPDSLHTIAIVSNKDVLQANGGLWVYNTALPLAAAAPLALLLWFVILRHFHPKNREFASSPGNPLMRCFVALFVTLALIAFGMYVTQLFSPNIGTMGALIAAAVSLFLYLQVRLIPYSGVAVCRQSLAPGPALPITRGWNFLLVTFILIIVTGILLVVQFLVNAFLIPAFATVVNVMFMTSHSLSKMLNSGVAQSWVASLFYWGLTLALIMMNMLMTLFIYGVNAGLLGRLYREGEAYKARMSQTS